MIYELGRKIRDIRKTIVYTISNIRQIRIYILNIYTWISHITLHLHTGVRFPL